MSGVCFVIEVLIFLCSQLKLFIFYLMLLSLPPLKASNSSLNIISIFLANSFLLSHILFYPSSIVFSFIKCCTLSLFCNLETDNYCHYLHFFAHRFSFAFASVVLFSNCFRETLKKKQTTRSLITQPV